MKALIEKIKQIWSIEELKNRIILTFSLVLVYRIGSFIVLPGVDPDVIQEPGGIVNLINLFSGGAFSRASIMALGIMPYISASIIMQLAGIAVPAIQKMQSDGESGRKKITQYTRILTIAICALQAPGYLTQYVPNEAIMGGQGATFLWWLTSVVLLIAGCVFAMWLGEKITDKGIGNGISILIMVGIIARLPQSFAQEFASRVMESNGGMIMILIELVIWFVIILASIMLVMAVRKIPVQYARRTASGSYEKNIFGARQFIPLKLNASGVMPIIFAQAIMFVPGLIGAASFMKDSNVGQWMQVNFSDMFGLWYNVLFAVLIIIFTYFYTAITVPTNKMADDLKRSGGFIPGIKPGTDTADLLDNIMSQITLPGSIFLAGIAIFPAIAVKVFGIQQGWALFYGGTSLLIMVGVAIDTMQQINSYLLNRHYDGLMKTGKNRKAVA